MKTELAGENVDLAHDKAMVKLYGPATALSYWEVLGRYTPKVELIMRDDLSPKRFRLLHSDPYEKHYEDFSASTSEDRLIVDFSGVINAATGDFLSNRSGSFQMQFRKPILMLPDYPGRIAYGFAHESAIGRCESLGTVFKNFVPLDERISEADWHLELRNLEGKNNLSFALGLAARFAAAGIFRTIKSLARFYFAK